MDEIRRRLRLVYLAKGEKSLSPKIQKNDNYNAIRKIINKSPQAVVGRSNADRAKILRRAGHDRVPTGGCVHAVGTRRRLRGFVPERPRNRSEGDSRADAGADGLEPTDALRAAGMEHKRYTMHFF